MDKITYKSYLMITKMMNKRGYISDDTVNESTMSYDDFIKKYSNKSRNKFFINITDENDRIYTYFTDNEKIGIKLIREIIEYMVQESINKTIIVGKENLTSSARQGFVNEKNIVIEYFNENELQIDITEHSLVPEHILLDKEEKKNILKIFNKKDLPIIDKNDPVSRFFGAKPGDIFKIIRPSETAGKEIYYRIVL